MSDLGKIVITMEGNYNPEKEYERLSCVRHNRATWISTQTTLGNEPLPNSDFWKQVTEDGYTATNVSYDVEVPASSWVELTGDEIEYKEYPYRAEIIINGITAASNVRVTFNYDEMMSNDFAPLCNSFYGGIYIYSKHLITRDIVIPVITADKFYNTDEVLGPAVKNSINENVDNLYSQLRETKENVIDNQSSMKILRNVVVDFEKSPWYFHKEFIDENKTQLANTIDYAYACDIPVDGIDETWVATAIFTTFDAASCHFAPIVVTGKHEEDGSSYVRIFSNYDKIESLTIPTIILQKVSNSTLNTTENTTNTEIQGGE